MLGLRPRRNLIAGNTTLLKAISCKLLLTVSFLVELLLLWCYFDVSHRFEPNARFWGCNDPMRRGGGLLLCLQCFPLLFILTIPNVHVVEALGGCGWAQAALVATGRVVAYCFVDLDAALDVYAGCQVDVLFCFLSFHWHFKIIFSYIVIRKFNHDLMSTELLYVASSYIHLSIILICRLSWLKFEFYIFGNFGSPYAVLKP